MTDRKSRTQQNIIATAKKLFIARGFKGTTTQEIAKEAGIAEMTLFRHFSTKEELFAAIIQPIVSFLDELHIEQSLNLRNVLERFLEKCLWFLTEERELMRLLLHESYLTRRSLNPILNVTEKMEKLFSALNIKNRELLIRLVMGFLLSYIFLPGEEKPGNIIIGKFLDKIVGDD